MFGDLWLKWNIFQICIILTHWVQYYIVHLLNFIISQFVTFLTLFEVINEVFQNHTSITIAYYISYKKIFNLLQFYLIVFIRGKGVKGYSHQMIPLRSWTKVGMQPIVADTISVQKIKPISHQPLQSHSVWRHLKCISCWVFMYIPIGCNSFEGFPSGWSPSTCKEFSILHITPSSCSIIAANSTISVVTILPTIHSN